MVSTMEAIDELTSLREKFLSRDNSIIGYDDIWANFSKSDFNCLADNCNDEKEHNTKLNVLAQEEKLTQRRKLSTDLCEIATTSVRVQSSGDLRSKDDSFIAYDNNWAHFSDPKFNCSITDHEEDNVSVMKIVVETQKRQQKSTEALQSQTQKTKTDESINYFSKTSKKQTETNDESTLCLLNCSDMDDYFESLPKASTGSRNDYLPMIELGKSKDELGMSPLALPQNMEADSDHELAGPFVNDKANMKKEVAKWVKQLKKSSPVEDFFKRENKRSQEKIIDGIVRSEQDFDVDTIISGIQRNRQEKKAIYHATNCTNGSYTQKSFKSASCGSLKALKKSQHSMVDLSHTMKTDYSNFVSSLNDSKKKKENSAMLLKFNKEMEENSTFGGKKRMDYSNLIVNRMNKLKSEIESNNYNQDELSKPKSKQMDNLDDFVSTFMDQYVLKTIASNADGSTTGAITTNKRESLMNPVKFSSRRIRVSSEKLADCYPSATNLKSGHHSGSKLNEILMAQQNECFSSPKSNEKRNINDQVPKTVYATTRTRLSKSMKMKMATDIVLCAASKTELSMPKSNSAGNRNRTKASLAIDQIDTPRLKEGRDASMSQTMKMKLKSDLVGAQRKRGETQQSMTESIAMASPTRMSIDRIHSKTNKSGKYGNEELLSDKRQKEKRKNDGVLERSRHTTRNREFEKGAMRRSTKISPTRVSCAKMTLKQTQSNMSKGHKNEKVGTNHGNQTLRNDTNLRKNEVTDLEGSRHTYSRSGTEKSLADKSTKRTSSPRASTVKMTKSQPDSNVSENNSDGKVIVVKGVTESTSDDTKHKKVKINELELTYSRHINRSKEKRSYDNLTRSMDEQQRSRKSKISPSDDRKHDFTTNSVPKRNRNYNDAESSTEPSNDNPSIKINSDNLVGIGHQSQRGRESEINNDVNDRRGQSRSQSNSRMRSAYACSRHEQTLDSLLDCGSDHTKSRNCNQTDINSSEMKYSKHKVQNSREETKSEKINESKHINESNHKKRSSVKNKKSEKRSSRSPVPPSNERSMYRDRNSRDRRPRRNSKSRKENKMSRGHTSDVNKYKSHSSSKSRKSTTSKSDNRLQSREGEINSSCNSKGNIHVVCTGANNELSFSSCHAPKMRMNRKVARANSMEALSMNTKRDLTTLQLQGGSSNDTSSDMSSTMTNQVMARYSVRRHSER